MAKRKFHMMQANMGGKDWIGLSFRHYIDTEKSVDRDPLMDPIIASVCGEKIEYGKLFAYLFRRFGYPDRGWDNYKELVKYYLTTPHPDLVLRISPCVGNASAITLEFVVEGAAFFAIEDYSRRDQTAWNQRALDFAEQQGLPIWMAELLDLFNKKFLGVYPGVPFKDWRQMAVGFFPFGGTGSRAQVISCQFYDFLKAIYAQHAGVEPYPPRYERPAMVQDWNEDDPLKPFARAAIMALEDLRTPVGVRDQSINAFGEVESGRADVDASPSAGYPSGAMGNSAPKEFAELHTLILKLGKGNAKRGIKKALLIIGNGAAK